MKKIAIFFAVIILMAIFATTKVFADPFTSTLHIYPKSTVIGTERTYDNNKHKISIRADDFYFHSADLQKLVITINKKGWFWTETQLSRKIASYTLGNTTTTYMGNVGDGKRFYKFATDSNTFSNVGGSGTVYSGIISNYVRMSSYN